MSSHREAPEISKDPVADSSDLYAFVSPDKPDTVTLIANYVPLQQPAGGPNFYEFGTDKDSPSRNAHTLRARPWSVNVYGESEVRGSFDLEDLLKGVALEERIYRFRCVEAWSMVVPWVGFPLSTLLARFKPTSRAKYVEFTTLYDPRQMPGQRVPVLTWPYVEGLRMDEAMHPLAIMASVLGKLGDKADRVVPVFVSVDPERDTPKVLKTYLASFGPSFVGLTGKPADIAKLAHAYGVYYAKHPLPGGTYSVDHSSAIYLLGPEVDFIKTYDEQEGAAAIAKDLKTRL